MAKRNERVDVVEIAEFIGSPISFTSKILQKLVKGKFISSSKGRNGGFYLSEKQLESLTISDIFFAIEEKEGLTSCALGLAECGSLNACPIHYLVLDLRNDIKKILDLKVAEIKDYGIIKGLSF